MSNLDFSTYASHKNNVKREIVELSAFLETVEAKTKERVWITNQSSGELDDTKLVDSLTGERSIYKFRGDDKNSMFFPRPKRVYVVFDLSARFLLLI
jgi:hypothetical protein